MKTPTIEELQSRIAELEIVNQRLKKANSGRPMNAPKPHIGGTIRILRLEKAITQTEFGKALGYSMNNDGKTCSGVSYLEGRGISGYTLLERASVKLGIKPSELMRRHEERMEAIAAAEAQTELNTPATTK